MNNTYTSEMPYSESLQHYGVQGMKWGIRRYQNKDGTRTSLGKKRYRKGGDLYKPVSGNHEEATGIKNAPRRLAEGIIRGVKQKLAERMPFMLNDEEVQRYTDRQRSENAYLNARADKRITKQKGKQENYGVTLLKNAANKAMGIAVDKTMNKAMDRLLETNDEKALRETTTSRNLEDTQNDYNYKRLLNIIADNTEANSRDEKQMNEYRTEIDIHNQAIRDIDRMLRNPSISTDEKNRLRAVKVSNKAKADRLTIKYQDLATKVTERTSENEIAQKSINSLGYIERKKKKDNKS